MRKIVIIAGIAVAAIVGIAIANGGSESEAAPTAAAQSSEAPAPVDIPAEAREEISPQKAAYIAAGDDWIVKMRAQVDASAASTKALDDLMNASITDPGYQDIVTANDEATAAFTLATTNLTAATTAMTDASADCGLDCLDLTSAHLQVISAQASLMTATDSTRSGAEQAMTDAVAKWDAAKAGV